MRIRLAAILLILSTLFTPSARAHWEEHDVNGQYMFGYAGTGDNLSLYMPEIESNRIPTNVQSIAVRAATDNLGAKLSYLKGRHQRAILVLDDLLFRNDPSLNTACGDFAYRPRLDFKTKFDNWLNLNRSYVTEEYVAVLVINSEVNNRCISFGSMDAVTQYVESKVPSIPTAAGYSGGGVSKDLPEAIPAALDGIIFFMYQVFDPRTDVAYQAGLNHLKSKMTPEQRLILVPDGYYDSGHMALGWPKWYLGYAALNYMNLALNDPKVVGLVIFIWPSFDEFGEHKLGTRDLPQSVRDRHRMVGCGLKIQNLLVPCE